MDVIQNLKLCCSCIHPGKWGISHHSHYCRYYLCIETKPLILLNWKLKNLDCPTSLSKTEWWPKGCWLYCVPVPEHAHSRRKSWEQKYKETTETVVPVRFLQWPPLRFWGECFVCAAQLYTWLTWQVNINRVCGWMEIMGKRTDARQKLATKTCLYWITKWMEMSVKRNRAFEWRGTKQEMAVKPIRTSGIQCFIIILIL